MKKFKALLASVFALLLGGCVNNVTYDLSSYMPEDSVGVRDAREIKRLETTEVDGIKHALYIGENNLVPGPEVLVGSKLGSIKERAGINDLQEVALLEFDLVLWFPRHRALLAGAAMAGGGYALGIAGQAMLSDGELNSDGVIAKISLEAAGSQYSCSAFVDDYDAVGALMGYRVSGVELQSTFNRAIEECIKKL
ncbi:hypothetical protein JF535_11145 [Microbulbifer salipaludis]|uniref:Uncharacterized protein n=1 Tax=Microbulbifer salipaludis TaxID=187980 RepID=A0ABS3E7W8_9GAMM|nr:hypothetical protein [Microbulbifer salipaludis]MBN8431407.1 hypothetical protein [Microbulbifer salipaludis]